MVKYEIGSEIQFTGYLIFKNTNIYVGIYCISENIININGSSNRYNDFIVLFYYTINWQIRRAIPICMNDVL
jgi:hypothetical protein